jgi:tetratricopeptide (TPR) repeat protein
MSQIIVDRIKKQLAAAEGYLVLNLPERALEILESRADWATMQYEASFLAGETYRVLGRYREALKPLEVAVSLRPGDIGIAIALGWCYKRTHRLAQAIDCLARALRDHPREAILHYNLACYWSLASNPRKALESLELALDLDPDVRSMIPEEADFDPLRGTPEFDRLVGPAGLIP